MKPRPRAGVSVSGRLRQVFALTPDTWRGTIQGMDDIPDFSDLDGLTRLARQAIEAIERMDLPDHKRQV